MGPAVIGADDALKRAQPHPVATAFVAEKRPPTSGPCGFALPIYAVDRRPGAHDEHDAEALLSAGNESNERVMGNDVLSGATEPVQNAVHRAVVSLATGASYPETESVHHAAMACEHPHRKILEYELDLVFVVELEVRTGAPPFGQDVALAVREETLGLRGPGIDSQHAHGLVSRLENRDKSCQTIEMRPEKLDRRTFLEVIYLSVGK